MLRNRLLPQLPQLPPISLCRRAKGNNAIRTNATRQSNIISKLFGSRLTGTKKHWYPCHNTNGNSSNNNSSSGSFQSVSVMFQSSQFGKSKLRGSRNNTRRMSVLNKLFMTHITDLLATGQAAESILGRGLQVSRVKICSDFSCINVYWLGSDISLEADLQRCSGQLRHELSQLRLMGEVPRIKFVRDKSGSSINNVEGILRSLNLSKPVEYELDGQGMQVEQQLKHSFDAAQTMRQEFYGNAATLSPTTQLSEMRHDVLGLDHRLIMDKILVKMRKSKSAWEQHKQIDRHQLIPELVCMHHKIAEVEANVVTLKSNHFAEFLANRRERKQTPERKKHQRELEDYVAETTTDEDDLQALTPDQRQRYTQSDYILEDHK
ncbi:uncharacterized protein LOC6586329 [Drosophila mojavensis]|uniref:Ribosome-binding factor A, mitochondrial n=1 Tax=Drosophila mojavensis TaxID=7230 RepID=B4L8U1_DROMO|nr:uncharacterized protein LOC6586329 [Drosophila mojavensis]EDW08066.1 uncharacterized protein Dmoj_GI14290 [Drosophila mojavensis]